MNTKILKSILCHVAAISERDAPSDRELLRRFLEARDQVAFSQLLCRHGPLVWNVCRQMLPNDADAEDAFQATFLALLQNATSIRDAERLSSWLHGVAYRIAMKTRRSLANRRKRERDAARSESIKPLSDSSWDGLLCRVHEAISRLPDAERTAFVVCCMEGVPQGEAAKRLGWKPGTLTGRLCRARQKLLENLSRHGIVPSLAMAAVGLGVATARATVPESLTEKTIRIVTTTEAELSPVLIELAKGVIEMNARVKLLVAAVMLTTGMTVIVGGYTLGQSAPRAKPAEQPAIAAAPVPAAGVAATAPRPVSEERIVVRPTASKWEYKVLSRSLESITEQNLNNLGEEGWELCGVRDRTTVFKRAKTSVASVAASKTPSSTMGTGMGGLGMAGGMMPLVDAGGGMPGGMGAGGAGGYSGGAPGMTGTDAGMPGLVKGRLIGGSSGARTTKVYPLKHATVQDLLETLTVLFDEQAPKAVGLMGGSSGVRIIGEPRTNSFILMGDEAAHKSLAEILQVLDVETGPRRNPEPKR